MIKAIIATTAITPTHTPALKISPITSQLLNVSISKNRGNNEYFFISSKKLTVI